MENNKRDRREIAKKGIVVLFILILFLPGILWCVNEVFGVKMDVELQGFNDDVTKADFSAGTFLSGEYQGKYTSWFDTTLISRGFLTKTYTSIRYHLFNLGNRPIGQNGDVFEAGYINSELCINGAQDMTQEENQIKMKEYVQKLELLQDKLREKGKYLYVYLVSNKADFHYDNIPEKYKALASETAVKPTDYFDQLMRASSVPYLNTDSIGRDLEYPAFYTTGIHWSRPFEQMVSKQIISEIGDITDKHYRKLEWNGVTESDIPFWRDTDVYDLLNIWNKNDQKYYEYSVEKQYPERYDRMRILLQGTSFADGLRRDILNNYPSENVYYVNRDSFLQKPDGTYHVFNKDWTSVDWKYYLDQTDIIVIETIAPELTNYSNGFVDHMLQVLEEYAPSNGNYSTMQALDGESSEEWDYHFMNGFYHREVNFAWAKDCCEVILSDEMLADSGLQLDYGVSNYLFDVADTQNVYIYYNGKQVFHEEYSEPWVGSVIVPADILQGIPSEDGISRVSVICSSSFNPAEMGLSTDNRELALHISYIGRAK